MVVKSVTAMVRGCLRTAKVAIKGDLVKYEKYGTLLIYFYPNGLMTPKAAVHILKWAWQQSAIKSSQNLIESCLIGW